MNTARGTTAIETANREGAGRVGDVPNRRIRAGGAICGGARGQERWCGGRGANITPKSDPDGAVLNERPRKRGSIENVRFLCVLRGTRSREWDASVRSRKHAPCDALCSAQTTWDASEGHHGEIRRVSRPCRGGNEGRKGSGRTPRLCGPQRRQFEGGRRRNSGAWRRRCPRECRGVGRAGGMAWACNFAKRQHPELRARRKRAGHAAPVELMRTRALGGCARDGRGGTRRSAAASSTGRQADGQTQRHSPRRRTSSRDWKRVARAGIDADSECIHTQGRLLPCPMSLHGKGSCLVLCPCTSPISRILLARHPPHCARRAWEHSQSMTEGLFCWTCARRKPDSP